MDSLKLNMVAVDELHPLIQVSGCWSNLASFCDGVGIDPLLGYCNSVEQGTNP